MSIKWLPSRYALRISDFSSVRSRWARCHFLDQSITANVIWTKITPNKRLHFHSKLSGQFWDRKGEKPATEKLCVYFYQFSTEILVLYESEPFLAGKGSDAMNMPMHSRVWTVVSNFSNLRNSWLLTSDCI